MCGLVGMFGNITLTHGKMFGDMLLMDAVRGKDSTGVVFVPLSNPTDNKRKPVVEKELGLPDNLWMWNSSDVFNSRGHVDKCPRVLIGHNRAATFGSVTRENAHPFVFGNIYGTHNGSLRDWSDLKNFATHDVDSKAIFDNISEYGIDDTWKKFTGAAALTWWDDDAQTFNVIRNHERPLLLAFTDDSKVAFYASEEWMIVEAAKRRGVKLKTEKDEKTGQEIPYVRRFEEHHHYSYEVTNTSFKLVRREKLEKKSPPPAAITKNGGVTTSTKSFGGSATYPVGFSTKAKGDKQINKNWAANMEKAGKDTRGVEFSLVSCLEGGLKFTAKLNQWDQKHVLTVFPDSWEEAERMKEDFYLGRRRYVTDCRLRQSQKIHFLHYGVSSRGISRILGHQASPPKKPSNNVLPLSPTKETKADVVEDQDYQEDKLPDNLSGITATVYRGPNGVWVDEHTWKKWASECTNGSTCIYCGDPLDINDHKEILWLDQKNCMCPECSKQPGAIASLTDLFPHLGQLA